MYDILADWYDRFQEIDYHAFVDYYEQVFKRFQLEPKLILDLGCGTGNITLPMAERGYEMIGLDASEEMLQKASEKAEREILFLHQDMTEFELYGTVDAMVCALDGVNYLTGDQDFKKMLSLLHYYLNPGGILIFDINSPYKFKEILDGNTFVYEEEDAYCIWENELEDGICYFDLTFFLKNADGSYTKQQEFHEERVYTEEEIRDTVRACGLHCLGVYDGLTFDTPKPDSERIFFVIQRPK